MRFSNKIKNEYEQLAETALIKSSAIPAVNRAAQKAIANKEKYQSVSQQTGVPWEWIAAIHMRESSANFNGVLHNGERIIGTGKKTKLVPKHRGPFSSWEHAAIDAIKLKRLHLITDWSMGRMLFEFERFNGFGYRIKGHSGRSPYVWAGTNHQRAGKYVSDGKYSRTAMDRQLGAFSVFMRIKELDKPKKDIVQSSRRLTIIDRISKFLEWSGVLGFFSFGTLQDIREFLTDWKVLALLIVGFLIYLALKYLKFMSIREFKEGRYVPSLIEDEQKTEDDSQWI